MEELEARWGWFLGESGKEVGESFVKGGSRGGRAVRANFVVLSSGSILNIRNYKILKQSNTLLINNH